MMNFNVNTKIASSLKHNTDAHEAIVSLLPKFTKLRNPILRKVIAGRTSIAMASKIGGYSADDVFKKLRPIGFEMEKGAHYDKCKR